jgi:hypothetical protein
MNACREVGGKAPRILILGTGWRRVVRSSLRSLQTPGDSPRSVSTGWEVGVPQKRSARSDGEEKNLFRES